MNAAFRLLLGAIVVNVVASGAVHAQLLTYSGTVVKGGQPVSNGFVVAGRFKAGFDPNQYKFVYGGLYDGTGNMIRSDYSKAVGDGNFIPFGNLNPFPIGAGTTTSALGTFNQTSLPSGAAGSKIWLFAFDTPNPDDADLFALASSSDWTMGSVTSVSSAGASQFVFGSKQGVAINLQAYPVPEHGTSTLVAVTIAAVFALRCCKRLYGAQHLSPFRPLRRFSAAVSLSPIVDRPFAMARRTSNTDLSVPSRFRMADL